MTGSTLGMIITSIVVVIVMAAWIILVFYADAYPTWRRKAPSGHGPADPAARATAGRAEESPDLVSGEMEASPAARQEAGAPAERAAGIASGSHDRPGYGQRRPGRCGGAARGRPPRPECPAGRRGGPTVSTVRITRPRHPFEGQPLPVLGSMRRHGAHELLVVLPDGSKRLVPASWTDAAPGGGSAPGTLGAAADLLGLSVLVSALCARSPDEREQAARKPPAWEDSRAACPAQSAIRPGSGVTAGPDRPASPRQRRSGGRAAGGPDRQGASRRRGQDGKGGGR
jgi:Family of unknown function (DUF5372)